MAIVAAKVFGGLGSDWRPSHFDEWRSLALAQAFVDTGVLGAEEPVGSPNGLARDISDRNRSLGYVALLGAWAKWFPRPVSAFKVLGLAFLLLYIGGVYALCRCLGVRRWATLPAVLGLGMLPTDTLLLGPALAVPSSLSMGLLCFALVSHLQLSAVADQDLMRRRSGLWWSLLLGMGAVLAVVYPLTLIVLGGLITVDVLARPQISRTRYVRIIGTLGVIGAALFLAGEWQGDVSSSVGHLAELFLLDERWHLVRFHVYRLDYLIPAALLLLACIGAGVSLLDRDRLWLAAAFLGPLIAYVGYRVTGSGLVVPYQRIGLYMGFGAVVCAGVAVERALVEMENRDYSRRASAIFLGVLSLVLILSPRLTPPSRNTLTKLRPSPALEEVAERIASEYAAPARVFAAPADSMYLEALTGLDVSPDALDSLLTGYSPPAMDCDFGWEIVVGRCPCANYDFAFRVGEIRVFVRNEDFVRATR